MPPSLLSTPAAKLIIQFGCNCRQVNYPLSEVLDLRYDDINFETNLISIWINKGDKPRSKPMTVRVGTILQARRINDASKPFTIDRDQAENAWTWVRKTMGLSGDKEFVMHALKHTTATR